MPHLYFARQGEANQLSGQALVVNITSATNADVDAGASATVITAASQAELLVAFSPGANQVEALPYLCMPLRMRTAATRLPLA